MVKSLKPDAGAPVTPPAQSTHQAASPPRRNFLYAFAAAAIGLVVSLFPVGSGLLVFLDPLRGKNRVPLSRRKEGGQGGYLKIATLDAVPDDGIPRRFPVVADLSDAWNFSPGQPIGAVYLRRTKGEKAVQVFHATCPHAGCSVAYSHDSDPGKCLYKCPCHNSAFGLDGQKVDLPGKDNPSPRPLDALVVDGEKLASSGEIWVQFLNFYTGIHEKKPKL
jgi:menaquinol-cytochrome c reductase iron-sulfur subunit